jgi:hypothetical protein
MVIELLQQWMEEALTYQDYPRYSRLRLDYECVVNAKKNEN